jgi:hypothetical protein
MPKIKALSASVTGLPWSTGQVHTAKCQSCEQHNESMFRRCQACPYAICCREECFMTKGFSHFCQAIPPNGSGPYPTQDVENEILAQHEAYAPQRPARLPEPPQHTAAWVPFSNSTGPSTPAIPSLNPSRVRNPPKSKKGSAKKTPTSKKSTPAGKNNTPISSGQHLHTSRLIAPASPTPSQKRPFQDESETANEDYAPRSATRSGRKTKAARLDEVVPSITHLTLSNTAGHAEGSKVAQIANPHATSSRVTTTGYIDNGNLTVDVRGIDYLTIAPYEGFHVVQPSVNGGLANGNPELVYRWISSDDLKVREEPVARIYDANKKPFEPMAPRVVRGPWRGGKLKDDMVSFFQNSISSVRINWQPPNQAQLSPAVASNPPAPFAANDGPSIHATSVTSSLPRVVAQAIQDNSRVPTHLVPNIDTTLAVRDAQTARATQNIECATETIARAIQSAPARPFSELELQSVRTKSPDDSSISYRGTTASSHSDTEVSSNSREGLDVMAIDYAPYPPPPKPHN